jgi:hypothetical protein
MKAIRPWLLRILESVAGVALDIHESSFGL